MKIYYLRLWGLEDSESFVAACKDISPSLYYTPQPVEAREGYSAERDVSDYLFMSYCLEKDILLHITT